MTRAPGHIFQRRTIDPGQAIATLTKIESAQQNKALTALLGGAALCMLVVLGFTLLYAIATFMLTGGPSVTVVFCILPIFLLPPLFLIAKDLQRPLPGPDTPASEQLRLRRDDDDDTDDNDEVKALARRGKSLGERANLGPRLVLWGIARLRERSAFGTVPVDRVALALLTLVDAGGGISPVKILLPEESADQLEPLLGVLLYHGLADLSKRSDRVWITTDAKRKLGLPV